ncbi:hypothetical protein BGZ46_010012 [Entomortierella lignicola]|nr:hypothetical protein BGZ46_010012 [Entomortierella lignicola]
MGKPFKPLKVTEPSDTTTAFYIDVEIEKAYIKVMSMSEYKEHQKLSFADRHKFLKENHDEIVGLDEGGLPILPDMPEEKRPSPHP